MNTSPAVLAQPAPLLEVKELQVQFSTSAGLARAVDGVSFVVREGETLGIVGESGCGKSVTSLAIMRLIADPPGRIFGGEILFQGTDLLTLSDPEMRSVRGNRISMVFQEPMTSLNPVLRIGEQIAETIVHHQKARFAEARERAIAMLRLVGISTPDRHFDSFPHQLSGGMRQRVMIAMALVCNPSLLIADEPTTALDVTIQAQILDLIRRLKTELGMAVILITHDLGVIAEMAQRVCVMYAGKLVETATVGQLFQSPRHPYTKGLLGALPRRRENATRAARLKEIPGVAPPLTNLPGGCRFCPRLANSENLCRAEEPPWIEVEPEHLVRCWATRAQSSVV